MVLELEHVELTDYCCDRVLFLYLPYAFSLNQLRGKSPLPEDEVLCFMLINVLVFA